MLLSMTGYGQGSAETEAFSVDVEIRSVNNRFCEVSVSLPRDLNHLEQGLRKEAKKKLLRGKISVRVTTEKKSGGRIALKVDEEATKGYAEVLRKLHEVSGFDHGPSIGHLLSFNDIFVSEDKEDPEHLAAAVKDAMSKAIANISSMRREEGIALEKDLEERLAGIAKEMEFVKSRAPERVSELAQKLKDRLSEMIEEGKLDEDRIGVEIAILADKLDVNEEVVRLDSHMDMFSKAIGGKETEIGRKMNFVVQEMNREINTIGSKANDADIAHSAVKMKEELEKIREQVANVL